jgi:hypothetical protein
MFEITRFFSLFFCCFFKKKTKHQNNERHSYIKQTENVARAIERERERDRDERTKEG